MTKEPTIFVQIASYRDPQLIPTLEDILEKAARPFCLRFGICRQCHPEDVFDNLDKYRSDERFRILDVNYTDSKGACWARHQIQRMYYGETYTLQLDSHMRFVQDWDLILIDMFQNLQSNGHPKPLITAYAPSFNPENDPEERVQQPWRMTFDRFIPEGAIFFLPETIPDWENIHEPVPARFYSAHMAFTLGAFSHEVPHNPEYYFHGEEISIAVRAYTHGYDLFHPHRVVIWHEYTRKGRTKQWDDDEGWMERNAKSHLTNRRLFGMDGLSSNGDYIDYGFGKERTLQDYEEYAGILFSQRAVQQYTLDKQYPPNPSIESWGGYEQWIESFKPIFRHCIDLWRTSVPEVDYGFWALSFHDEAGETLFRQDVDKDAIKELQEKSGDFHSIWREFETKVQPKFWTVWPYSESKGWCKKIKGNL